MKSSTALSLLALAASAAASPLAIAAAAPELQDRGLFPIGCFVDNNVLIMAGLSDEFCAAYMQPTSTAIVIDTALATDFVTITTTETVVVTPTVTLTATPAVTPTVTTTVTYTAPPAIPTVIQVIRTRTPTAIPTVTPISTLASIPFDSPLICGAAGYASATSNTTFFNNDGSYDRGTCQDECEMHGPGTFAFGSNLCACYSEAAKDVIVPLMGSPYFLWDVGCPRVAPYYRRPGPPVKRDGAACAPDSARVPPRIIQTLNPDEARLSNACSCLLKNEVPAACIVVSTLTLRATTTILDVKTANAIETANFAATVTVTASY